MLPVMNNFLYIRSSVVATTRRTEVAGGLVVSSPGFLRGHQNFFLQIKNAHFGGTGRKYQGNKSCLWLVWISHSVVWCSQKNDLRAHHLEKSSLCLKELSCKLTVLLT